MEFGLTKTQQMIQTQIRDYVTENVIGENLDWDDVNFPHDVYDDLLEMGILGLHLPEEAGGEGFDPITAGLVYEELGRGDVGLTMLALSENLATKIIWEYGSAQHQDIAKRVCSGEEHICFALTEPDQGSDAQNLDTTAEPTDEGYVLSGEKTAITGATLADHCLVIARETGGTDDIRGYLLPLDADGVDVQPYAGLGCEVSGWGQIFLDDVEISAEARISDENAFKMAMRTFDKSRAWIALYALGAAQQSLDETATYLTEREAMGNPLASYQGPQFEHAEWQTRVDAARLKAYQTLWKADEGKSHTKDAAMTKWYAPEVAVDTVRACLVLHGHYGYSDDFGIGKRLQDVLGQQIADGAPHVQKLIVARETFGREYLSYNR
jgi:cyclohexanecarboxyl-CoA dehydrogenase